MDITETINSIKSAQEEALKKVRLLRFKLPYTSDEFRTILLEYCNLILLERGEVDNSNNPKVFEVNEFNKEILNQLYYYSKYDQRFDGNLNKGIMLMGYYGVGKSVIMESWGRLLNNFTKDFTNLKGLKYVKSFELFEDLKSDINLHQQKIVIIDELGREKKTGKDYGEEIQPVIEWLMKRYDTNLLTHGTTNYSYEQLCSSDFYGEMIGDRLKSMFNFIHLKGKSLRK